jgi:chemotaxis response regulator CheB
LSAPKKMSRTLRTIVVHPNALKRLGFSNAVRNCHEIYLVGSLDSVGALDDFIAESGVPDVVLLCAELADEWENLGAAKAQRRWGNATCTVLSLPVEEHGAAFERWLHRFLTPTLVTARFKPFVRLRQTQVAAQTTSLPLDARESVSTSLVLRPSRRQTRVHDATEDAKQMVACARTKRLPPANKTGVAPRSIVERDNRPNRLDECTAHVDVHEEASAPLYRSPAGAQPQSADRSSPVVPSGMVPDSGSPFPNAAGTNSQSKIATVKLGGIEWRPRWKGASMIVIASSTGGPDALAVVLAQLPETLRVPVVLVQHMGQGFTTPFAHRLNRLCKLPVKLARDNVVPVAGEVWLAPGDRHVEVTRTRGKLRLSLLESPAVHGCRPAADVTLLSLVDAAPGEVLVVVLTGMGSDGAAGAEALHRAGCRVIAQDEESSIVWSMPSAVIKRGAADLVVPLDKIADSIVTLARSGDISRPAERKSA